MAKKTIGPSRRNNAPASRDGGVAPRPDSADGQRGDDSVSGWSQGDKSARQRRAAPNALREALRRASIEDDNARWSDDPAAQPPLGSAPREPPHSTRGELPRQAPPNRPQQREAPPPARQGQAAPNALREALRRASIEDDNAQWSDDLAPQRQQSYPARQPSIPSGAPRPAAPAPSPNNTSQRFDDPAPQASPPRQPVAPSGAMRPAAPARPQPAPSPNNASPWSDAFAPQRTQDNPLRDRPQAAPSRSEPPTAERGAQPQYDTALRQFLEAGKPAQQVVAVPARQVSNAAPDNNASARPAEPVARPPQNSAADEAPQVAPPPRESRQPSAPSEAMRPSAPPRPQPDVWPNNALLWSDAFAPQRTPDNPLRDLPQAAPSRLEPPTAERDERRALVSDELGAQPQFDIALREFLGVVKPAQQAIAVPARQVSNAAPDNNALVWPTEPVARPPQNSAADEAQQVAPPPRESRQPAPSGAMLPAVPTRPQPAPWPDDVLPWSDAFAPLWTDDNPLRDLPQAAPSRPRLASGDDALQPSIDVVANDARPHAASDLPADDAAPGRPEPPTAERDGRHALAPDDPVAQPQFDIALRDFLGAVNPTQQAVAVPARQVSNAAPDNNASARSIGPVARSAQDSLPDGAEQAVPIGPTRQAVAVPARQVSNAAPDNNASARPIEPVARPPQDSPPGAAQQTVAVPTQRLSNAAPDNNAPARPTEPVAQPPLDSTAVEALQAVSIGPTQQAVAVPVWQVSNAAPDSKAPARPVEPIAQPPQNTAPGEALQPSPSKPTQRTVAAPPRQFSRITLDNYLPARPSAPVAQPSQTNAPNEAQQAVPGAPKQQDVAASAQQLSHVAPQDNASAQPAAAIAQPQQSSAPQAVQQALPGKPMQSTLMRRLQQVSHAAPDDKASAQTAAPVAQSRQDGEVREPKQVAPIQPQPAMNTASDNDALARLAMPVARQPQHSVPREPQQDASSRPPQQAAPMRQQQAPRPVAEGNAPQRSNDLAAQRQQDDKVTRKQQNAPGGPPQRAGPIRAERTIGPSEADVASRRSGDLAPGWPRDDAPRRPQQPGPGRLPQPVPGRAPQSSRAAMEDNASPWSDDLGGQRQQQNMQRQPQQSAPGRPPQPSSALSRTQRQAEPGRPQQGAWPWPEEDTSQRSGDAGWDWSELSAASQPAQAAPSRAQAPRPDQPQGSSRPQNPPTAPREGRQEAPQRPAQAWHGVPEPPASPREIAPRRAPEAAPSGSREIAIRAQQPAPPHRSLAPRREPDHMEPPQDIFADALASVKKAVWVCAMFSVFTNVLTLAGPLFMLQVYDRVLISGSIPTLVVLSVLLVVLYVALGLLEMLRGQILNRIAGRLDAQLGPATMEALPRHRLATGKGVADEPLRDLGTLRQFISGSGPAAFFDLPWAPLFMLIITMMHWALGVVTLIGMMIMVVIAVANEIWTKSLILEGKKATERATKLALESGRNLEAAVSMGMMDPIVTRWQAAQQRAAEANRLAGDRMAAFTSGAKIFRMFMQSALLAAGALLVIDQQISSGMMIAVSIIGGKALGPIGSVVSQWRGLVGAREAFSRLKSFHQLYPAEPQRMSLPAPKGRIEARNLHATPPGAELPALRDVSFSLEAGQALGVIGASAAGKSTLARVLIGLWPPDRGSVRLDGADLRMWNRDELGPKVGYLPQMIELFDGTIAQNIGRFYPDATPEKICRAAQRVGVHDMIVDLPDGYNFRVGENGSRLSAGQRQRIGLARAVFGDPVLVILDEPNANLDIMGEAALNRALVSLKASRTTVILITHRPNALDAVDHILVLDKGEARVFGPKAQVLKALTRTGNTGGKPAAVTAQAGKAPAVAALSQRNPTKADTRMAALPRKEAWKGA